MIFCYKFILEWYTFCRNDSFCCQQKVVHFAPESLVQFTPELAVHFAPELVVQYRPDYTFGEAYINIRPIMSLNFHCLLDCSCNFTKVSEK